MVNMRDIPQFPDLSHHWYPLEMRKSWKRLAPILKQNGFMSEMLLTSACREDMKATHMLNNT